MSTSNSDEELYNERSALVPAENPAIPSYRPDSDLSPMEDRPNKTVLTRFCSPCFHNDAILTGSAPSLRRPGSVGGRVQAAPAVWIGGRSLKRRRRSFL